MRPGPAKRFDPDEALQKARDVFWRRGYEGTAISELESELGIGRKSLYDTFGGKRQLYLMALEQYTATVISSICERLGDPRKTALQNIERVLDQLQRHHATSGSLGCLLGVAMAQADPADEELAELLRSYLTQLERAFEKAIGVGQREGSIDRAFRSVDVARNLVAMTQGMALLGRVSTDPAAPKSIVRAALVGLRTRSG